MDLYLMDAILKGHIPQKGSVLDLGCGGGRNAVYFLNNGYEYEGVDADESQVRLSEFVTRSIEGSSVHFHTQRLQGLDLKKNLI